jgi:hypothetical protein
MAKITYTNKVTGATDETGYFSSDNANEIKTSVNAAYDSIDTKVDKVTGKQLSTEDYTTSEKNKLANLSKSDVGLGNVDNTSDVNKPVSTATQTAINNAVIGLYDDRGNYDASGNVFPSSGGSGTSGAILKGDIWLISVAGTLGGISVIQGDSIRALSDAPGQISSNWAIGLQGTALTYASQAEAEAGTENTKVMSALRVLQSVVYQLSNYSFSVLNTTSKYIIGSINELFSSKTDKLIIANRQTSSYTLVLSDKDKIVEMNVATANNLTVPPNSSVAFDIGTQIIIAQYGAGQTTIVAGSGVTLRSDTGKLKIAVQYSAVTLIKIATDEWYVIGGLSA